MDGRRPGGLKRARKLITSNNVFDLWHVKFRIYISISGRLAASRWRVDSRRPKRSEIVQWRIIMTLSIEVDSNKNNYFNSLVTGNEVEMSDERRTEPSEEVQVRVTI